MCPQEDLSSGDAVPRGPEQLRGISISKALYSIPNLTEEDECRSAVTYTACSDAARSATSLGKQQVPKRSLQMKPCRIS